MILPLFLPIKEGFFSFTGDAQLLNHGVFKTNPVIAEGSTQPPLLQGRGAGLRAGLRLTKSHESLCLGNTPGRFVAGFR